MSVYTLPSRQAYAAPYDAITKLRTRRTQAATGTFSLAIMSRESPNVLKYKQAEVGERGGGGRRGPAREEPRAGRERRERASGQRTSARALRHFFRRAPRLSACAVVSSA